MHSDFRMSLAANDDEEKSAKLESLKNQKKKKVAKAARLKKFRSTVNPMALCVSRVDVEGPVRTKDDYVEQIVRYIATEEVSLRLSQSFDECFFIFLFLFQKIFPGP